MCPSSIRQADQLEILFSISSAHFLEELLQFGFPVLGFVTAIWAALNVFERHSDRELLCWAWPAGLGKRMRQRMVMGRDNGGVAEVGGNLSQSRTLISETKKH